MGDVPPASLPGIVASRTAAPKAIDSASHMDRPSSRAVMLEGQDRSGASDI